MEELLYRYFVETLSKTERAVLFKALKQDAALEAEFVRLQQLTGASGMIRRTDDARWAGENYPRLVRQAGVRRFRRVALSVLKYAAVALLMVGIWYFTKQSAATDDLGYIVIEAPKGQRVFVTLADGTEAWLNSRTQLKVPNRFNRKDRTVELNGEGLFSVSENKEKPFIVQTGQYHIRVTGTKFNVFAYAESALFETELMEGSVFVFNKNSEKDTLRLLPNEKASVYSGRLEKSSSGLTGSHYIKNGIYGFENRSLMELSHRLEMWYNVKITFAKPETADYRFSGKFRQTDDIAHVLKAIRETGKFKYRITDENRIEIY